MYFALRRPSAKVKLAQPGFVPLSTSGPIRPEVAAKRTAPALHTPRPSKDKVPGVIRHRMDNQPDRASFPTDHQEGLFRPMVRANSSGV
jgi:hypothetical protein